MSGTQESREEYGTEDILKILEERKISLDIEEQERANRRPLIYRVDPFFKEMQTISPFVPRVISLGLFEREKWNKSPETVVKRENLKLDVAVMFFADMKKDLRKDWMKVSEEIVKEPLKMKSLYDEPAHLPEEFIQSALALDAIFVTSFLIYMGDSYTFVRPGYKSLHEDLVRKLKQTVNIISRESQKFVNAMYGDIFKLENQIPLELIQNTIQIIHAYASGQGSQVQSQNYNVDRIFEMFCRTVVVSVGLSCFPSIRLEKIIQGQHPGFEKCGHLLHCLAQSLWDEARPLPSDHDQEVCPTCKRTDMGSGSDAASTYVQLPVQLGALEADIKENFEENNYTLVTATELNKCGITFKAQDGFFPRFVQDRFTWWRATLYLPQIRILHEYTEQYWRNFLAFEGSYVDCKFHSEKSFLQYLTFMNELINTKDDVYLFCTGREPIIRSNQLGDHETVANLFNSLTSRQNNTMGPEWTSIRKKIMDFHYSDKRVKIVEFTDTYFGRPWLVISLIVASLLVMLNVLQSVFAILRYYNDDKN